MKKPESTLSYDRCVPVFVVLLLLFILLTPLFC
jgi:hypothetical protein